MLRRPNKKVFCTVDKPTSSRQWPTAANPPLRASGITMTPTITTIKGRRTLTTSCPCTINAASIPTTRTFNKLRFFKICKRRQRGSRLSGRDNVQRETHVAPSQSQERTAAVASRVADVMTAIAPTPGTTEASADSEEVRAAASTARIEPTPATPAGTATVGPATPFPAPRASSTPLPMTSRGRWKPRQRLLTNADADAVRYSQAGDLRPTTRANIAAAASEDGALAATATNAVSLLSTRRGLLPPAARNAEGGSVSPPRRPP